MPACEYLRPIRALWRLGLGLGLRPPARRGRPPTEHEAGRPARTGRERAGTAQAPRLLKRIRLIRSGPGEIPVQPGFLHETAQGQSYTRAMLPEVALRRASASTDTAARSTRAVAMYWYWTGRPSR